MKSEEFQLHENAVLGITAHRPLVDDATVFPRFTPSAERRAPCFQWRLNLGDKGPSASVGSTTPTCRLLLPVNRHRDDSGSMHVASSIDLEISSWLRGYHRRG